MQILGNYLTVKQAAAYLGVSANTLRNWGREGQIVERRHPINNYRLYKKTDLDRLVRKVERSATVRRRAR
jgi:excisionase family DNA binding protein